MDIRLGADLRRTAGDPKGHQRTNPFGESRKKSEPLASVVLRPSPQAPVSLPARSLEL